MTAGHLHRSGQTVQVAAERVESRQKPLGSLGQRESSQAVGDRLKVEEESCGTYGHHVSLQAETGQLIVVMCEEFRVDALAWNVHQSKAHGTLGRKDVALGDVRCVAKEGLAQIARKSVRALAGEIPLHRLQGKLAVHRHQLCAEPDHCVHPAPGRETMLQLVPGARKPACQQLREEGLPHRATAPWNEEEFGKRAQLALYGVDPLHDSLSSLRTTRSTPGTSKRDQCCDKSERRENDRGDEERRHRRSVDAHHADVNSGGFSPIIRVMSGVVTQAVRLERVEVFMDAIREHFDRHFDRGWLAMIIDELPIEASLVQQIRELLGLRSVYQADIHEVRYGVQRLMIFAAELRRHLLPVLRDRLQISGFTRSFRNDDAGRIHRQFVAIAFPANLQRLEELTASLAEALPPTDE